MIKRGNVLAGLLAALLMLFPALVHAAPTVRAFMTETMTTGFHIAVPDVANESNSDVLIAVVSSPNPFQVITPPPTDHWHLIQSVGSFDSGSSNTLAVYWKLGSTTHPPSYWFNFEYQVPYSSMSLIAISGAILRGGTPIDVSAGQAQDIGDIPWYLLPQPPVPQTPAVTTTQGNELLLTAIGSAEWQQYTPPNGLTLVSGVQANYAAHAVYSEIATATGTYGPFTITAQTTADFKCVTLAIF